MGFHTFDPERADRLDDPTRFRFCSREELVQHLPRGPDTRILDLGSGTGFYTDELAPYVGQIVALDLQREMHELYREEGVPTNVSLLTGDATRLPVAEDSLDGAFSTMTFHESTTPAALGDLRRVLAAQAPYVVVDWSGEGDGEQGPPRDERFDAARARELLDDAGFTVETATERTETFLVVARA